MKDKSIKYFRWTLRILSSIFILFFLFMFIGETFFPPESLNAKPMTIDSIFQLVLMGIGLIGLGLAWKWELLGGIVSLTSYVVLAIINPGARHFSMPLLFPAIAVLFIVLWVLSRNNNLKCKS